MENLIYYKDSNNKVMAIVIKKEYKSKGIDFISNDEDFFQIATMGHDKGHIIIPHFHNIIQRDVTLTSEALIIRKGKIKVDLFESFSLCHSFVLVSGDILVLLSGGHGFEMLEQTDMVEIKQGPFLGAIDKTRF